MPISVGNYNNSVSDLTMDPADLEAQRRSPLAPLANVPRKASFPVNDTAGITKQVSASNVSARSSATTHAGGLTQDRPYGNVNTVDLTSSTAHVASTTYSYQTTSYNPLPRTQVNQILRPGIPQPIQTYPGHHQNAYSSFPASVAQYATAHNLPPPVGRIKFSLTSPKDFTILSSKYRYGDVSTDDDFIESFRSDIVRLSSSFGNGAVFEQPGKEDDDEELLGTARWRIPLAAYKKIYAFFDIRDDVVVDGIPEEHLNAAYLHLRHLEEGYPEAKTLVEKGIPPHVASTLTGYQRGGVNFCLSKNGRALIADEMGLGKTLQSIAAMCAYVDEGPLLVLCPSSVRFNWKAEVLQWLGKERNNGTGAPREQHPALLTELNVQVFNSGKDEINKDAKVIVASYDLFTNMVKKGKIVESTFARIIVDESHMLKNTKAQRTKAALPILKAAKRCILLSGTPAFKNPAELFPQLYVLGGGKWWANEKEFREKYCYKSSTVGGRNNLELYSLMASTVMIRRKKDDVLKEVLPKKNRDLAHVAVDDPSDRKKLNSLMDILRDTKGNLGIVARGLHGGRNKRSSGDLRASTSDDDVMAGLEADLQKLGLQENDKNPDEDIDDGKAFLPKLFELTGRVKIPVVISQLKRWLNDNEGKIIVFAHHHSVLDQIEASLKAIPTIRIDGKTSPKKRQELVVSFQKDTRVRVAVLSTTAAGVGITLTASATVWFAEMYWTPGLLIQAEDRSHRIGQKNDVNVLYYVARDTLDEVLWKLAVRKFIAVGEMVDGSTSTLDVNKKGDAALLDVSLEHDNSLLEDTDVEEKPNESAFEDDSDDAAGWGRVVNTSPSRDAGEVATAGERRSRDNSFDSDCLTDTSDENSSNSNSFDSNCLTDDEEIKHENNSNTDSSEDEIEVVEVVDSDTEEEEF